MHAHAMRAAASTPRYKQPAARTNRRHEHRAAAQPPTYAFYTLFTLGRPHGKKNGMRDTRTEPKVGNYTLPESTPPPPQTHIPQTQGHTKSKRYTRTRKGPTNAASAKRYG